MEMITGDLMKRKIAGLLLIGIMLVAVFMAGQAMAAAEHDICTTLFCADLSLAPDGRITVEYTPRKDPTLTWKRADCIYTPEKLTCYQGVYQHK
jgi:hypothetical protein